MAFSMSNLNAAELQQIGASLSRPEELENNSQIEMQWALKAMDHATIHYNLISSVDPTCLRLTRIDDKLYHQFREEFPDLDVAKLNEDQLKSADAKEKWRNFCEKFKGEIEDYNMGTLLRLNCEDDYNPDTTTFSVRTQFLAIEIARNREGHNSCLYNKKQELKKLQNNST
uniref:Polysaccharide biosynthesis domain-containing protein n=1 Tax=Biomphalaria glabrata TaxID=6526 RepID=A0A2C9JV50_BIOGL